uniref:Uncharacterized protein n=1 Tax=Nelumbo nucifera TaxID=4432 RepID=A0A822YBL8_NELNU|nr:TPA_asm: hypothetical protein HUJ06_031448 [Nelumbo nucifera]
MWCFFCLQIADPVKSLLSAEYAEVVAILESHMLVAKGKMGSEAVWLVPRLWLLPLVVSKFKRVRTQLALHLFCAYSYLHS